MANCLKAWQKVIRTKRPNYRTNPECPDCGEILSYKDTRRRVYLDYGHEEDILYIRRFRCDKCKRLHTELPENVVPWKHYKKDVIRDVLEGYTVEDDPIAENGPADITMKRWKETMDVYSLYRNESDI